jgi:hypothetical protein
MISIGFSTTKKPVSRLVRWITKSKVSHSFIVFDWLGEKWILESEWAGVQVIPMSRFMSKSKGNIIVDIVDLPDATMDDLKLALQDSGVAYDYGGLFGAIFPIIGTWLKMKWKNPWQNTKAMFCSEFIVVWLQDLGLISEGDLIAGDTDPNTLLKFLKTVN